MASHTTTTEHNAGSADPGVLGNAHTRLDQQRRGDDPRPTKPTLGIGKLPGASSVGSREAAPTTDPFISQQLLKTTCPYCSYTLHHHPHTSNPATVHIPHIPPKLATPAPALSTTIPQPPTDSWAQVMDPHSTCSVGETSANIDDTTPLPSITCNVPATKSEITNMYLLDETGKPITSHTSKPFTTVPSIEGPQGERVHILAIVDSGAMINVIDIATYQCIASRLNKLSPSMCTLHMADGSLVPSSGVWSGPFHWGSAHITATFEVFPNGGTWHMLIDKPLLEQLHAVYDYTADTITLTVEGATVATTIHNFAKRSLNTNTLPAPLPSSPPTANHTKVCATTNNPIPNIQLVDTFLACEDDPVQQSGDVFTVSNSPLNDDLDTIFTRLKEKGPFFPPRVAKILDLITLGLLSTKEHNKVTDLVLEFADIFALSVQEVKPVDSITFHLNIPKDKDYPVKVNQCPLTQAQKEWYFPVLDDFVVADVLREIRPNDIKAAHPMVLAQKAHGAPGLSMDEIKWKIEDECIRLGGKLSVNMPPRPPPLTRTTDNPESACKPKWRITHNFNSVNKVCNLAPIVQGDIQAKQQQMAGHKYICIIDFASGFYAIKVEEEDQPYLCIYTEGRGYH